MSDPQIISFSVDRMVDTEGAAQLLGIEAATLVKWRSAGENDIPYVRIGRNIRYRTFALRDWVEKNTRK
jgi:predicted site-specific integrase-resolvase